MTGPRNGAKKVTQAMVTELKRKRGKRTGPNPGRKLWPQEETGM